ncbi:unconventional SNARE in the endoplasmic reticulum protein 1 [Entomortierella parvispora]|uniref:Unconventional SNARE in the endoplasmic reticulum protein 1 n=1 Tax=Entomortierella parvispora TaxID=205924 RepID=A0A9P3HMG2_9FUNG|nr:unconventional SNARE in the endoplasmic reticulum protein 1 [Entomortierella parvispora]
MDSSTPTVLEVNFRRLLAKCQARANAEQALQGADRAKFQATIKSLRNMILDLEKETSNTGRLDSRTLQEFSNSIESLAQMEEDVIPTNKIMTQTRIIAPRAKFDEGLDFNTDSNSSSSLTGLGVQRMTAEHSQTIDHVRIEPEKAENTHGMRPRGNKARQSAEQISKRTAWGTGRPSSGVQDPAEDQAQVEAALQNDRAQREEMEQGISRLVKQLRHNALTIQQTLVDEKKSGLFEDADQALDNNISRLGKERARLELYSKQSRKTKWMIWGIVLGVSIVFVLMFFVIRIF